MPENRPDGQDEPAVAEFERLLAALRSGRFEDAATHRRRLYQLGFVVSTKSPREPRSTAPRTPGRGRD